MPPNPAHLKNRLTAPAVLLAAGLAMAGVLMLLPARSFDALERVAAAALRPSQVGILSLRERAGRIVDRVKTHFGTAEQLAEAERKLKRLSEENHRLEAELAVARNRHPHPDQDAADDARERLLSARCVTARVLGHQARAFLARQMLLDAGTQAGVQPDALVLDARCGLIDQGSDANLQLRQFVLSRGCVWGKVVDVGTHTSTVRTVTEPGYRDLVRLAGPTEEGEHVRLGPQGILEGTGEPWARIRLVEVTEPVSVGDRVYTAAGKGVLPAPLLYGEVVRVERPVGASHWEIWMQPAVAPDHPERVAVLRIELNPFRVVSGEW